VAGDNFGPSALALSAGIAIAVTIGGLPCTPTNALSLTLSSPLSAPPNVPVTSNATCPQWHDPACVDIAHSCSVLPLCLQGIQSESLNHVAAQLTSNLSSV
jgi:hypothetical protein